MSCSFVDIDHLFCANISDPHRLLGIHREENKSVIRFFSPGSHKFHFKFRGVLQTAALLDQRGLFVWETPEIVMPTDYQILHRNQQFSYDPYAFSPMLSIEAARRFILGKEDELYKYLGAHACSCQGVEGTLFSVWAPNARQVSLVGDFNRWDARLHPMKLHQPYGIWAIFMPGVFHGALYKFHIIDLEGKGLYRCDPMARWTEMRPKNASIVHTFSHHFQDDAWMEKRKTFDIRKMPLNIYELHLGSWKRYPGQFTSYRALACDLADYVQKMNYTHIELLPIMEHPLDDSWGYQVSGYFAPTSRFGDPDDFAYFVDYMHQRGIGVILDWVAAHFLKDIDHLAYYDGTALYEHLDPKRGYQPQWDTHLFNYGRPEVKSFLLSSALYFCRRFHIDGLRVDAVTSMLYLDFGKTDGQWLSNAQGGREHLEAIEFLKELNTAIHAENSGLFTVAEESTAFPSVTTSIEKGGLGFDLKWMMGWMHDTLGYFKTPPFLRKWHQKELTFSMLYFYDEAFLLPLSHDEVVHLKCSIFSKMCGTDEEKYASVRLLHSFALCFPGKKLFFMGMEIGQKTEWNEHDQLSWYLLQTKEHQELSDCIAALNEFYKEHEALWKKDYETDGFSWVDCSDHERSVISYLRRGDRETLLCIHHFGDCGQEKYALPWSYGPNISYLFSTYKEGFPREAYLENGSLIVDLPPLSTLIYRINP